MKEVTNESCNVEPVKSKQKNLESLPKVYYQFIYSSSTRQQTEAREGTSCPWCNVQCGSMYALLRHLKCCHSRFSFLYTVSRSILPLNGYDKDRN